MPGDQVPGLPCGAAARDTLLAPRRRAAPAPSGRAAAPGQEKAGGGDRYCHPYRRCAAIASQVVAGGEQAKFRQT